MVPSLTGCVAPEGSDERVRARRAFAAASPSLSDVSVDNPSSKMYCNSLIVLAFVKAMNASLVLSRVGLGLNVSVAGALADVVDVLTRLIHFQSVNRVLSRRCSEEWASSTLPPFDTSTRSPFFICV